MTRLILFALFSALVLPCAEAKDESLAGTLWVKFSPVNVAGETVGCELNYMTTAYDRAYLNGNLIAANGSISVRMSEDKRSAGMMLKVGIRDISRQDTSFERPTFAYLQTKNGNTAKAKAAKIDGELGYKLFVYSLSDPAVPPVLGDMIESPELTLGYNRKAGGIDVFVPLNLAVADSNVTANKQVSRKYSSASVDGFSQCLVTVLSQITGTQ